MALKLERVCRFLPGVLRVHTHGAGFVADEDFHPVLQSISGRHARNPYLGVANRFVGKFGCAHCCRLAHRSSDALREMSSLASGSPRVGATEH